MPQLRRSFPFIHIARLPLLLPLPLPRGTGRIPDLLLSRRVASCSSLGGVKRSGVVGGSPEPVASIGLAEYEHGINEDGTGALRQAVDPALLEGRKLAGHRLSLHSKAPSHFPPVFIWRPAAAGRLRQGAYCKIPLLTANFKPPGYCHFARIPSNLEREKERD